MVFSSVVLWVQDAEDDEFRNQEKDQMVARHPRIAGLTFCISTLLLVAAQACAEGSLTVSSAAMSGIYTAGTKVVFTVKAAEGVGAVNLGKVTATVIRDGWHPVKASVMKNTMTTVEVSFTPTQVGWYLCEATLEDDPKSTTRIGVLVNPEKIEPSVSAPSDLEQFWDARRNALAAMPLQAEMTPVESPESQIECFSVEAPCPQTDAVRGYYARPAGLSLHDQPAILYLRAAGVSGDWCKASPQNATSLAKEYGAIVLDINAHGMLNGQPAQYYEDLEQQGLRSYWTQGQDDADKFYFVGMYVRLLRAVDFLAAQEAWDGKRLIAIGESQGGGQALAAAGLDSRVSAVVAVVPAMCDFTGPVIERLGGWPQPLGKDAKSESAQKIIEAVRYCDNVHLAAGSKANTLIFVGLADMTCPAPGVVATYNQLPGEKWIVAYPHKPHNGLPEEDLWIGDIATLQNQFIHKHIGR